jgi:sulfur relay (sulfurtransferase) DsrC/TusE family protein
MSVFHRATRHTLCDKYLIDLDIVNCHYVIVLDFMKRLNMSCVEIEKYCANTKKYRAVVAKHYGIELDQAKSLFIRLIYGGGLRKWKQDNNIDTSIKDYNMLFKMKNELIEFQNIVVAGNQHIIEDILLSSPDYFHNAYKGKREKTLMSFWCQSIERYIQEKCIMFLVDKYELYVNNFIPCQDGFMMRKEDYNNDIVDEINEFIHNELGYVVNMIDKPFDEKYEIGIPDVKHVYTPFDLIMAGDKQYAQYMIDIASEYRDIVVTGKDKIMNYFVYNGVYWEENGLHIAEFHQGRMDYVQSWCSKKFQDIMITIRKDPRFVGYVDDKERKNKEKTEKKINRLKNQINALTNVEDDESVSTIETEYNSNTVTVSKKEDIVFQEQMYNVLKTYNIAKNGIKKLSNNTTREAIAKVFMGILHVRDIKWDDDPNLFAFKNCIMDLRTGEFIQPRKEQYIKTTCNWSWDKDYDMTKVNDIQVLIESILPVKVVRDYYLLFNGSCLTGHKVQKVPINTGTGGNGKSLCRELVSGVVGGYGMKIPSDILTKPLNSGSPNPFIANMHMKRYLYFTEPEDNQPINSSTMKDLSGEQTVTGRALYSSTTEVNLTAGISGDTNTIPGFTNVTSENANSLLRRLVIIYFSTTAVTQEVYDSLEDKTNYNVKKNYAENKEWLNDHRQALFIILLEYAKKFIACPELIDNVPKDCVDRTIKHISGSSIVTCWFEDIFEVCDEDDEYVRSFRDVYKLFKDGDVFKRLNKAEKRTYNEGFFKQELLKSSAIKKGCIKYCKDYHNGKQLSVDYTLVGYKMKV